MKNNIRLKNIAKTVAMVLIGVVFPLMILIKFSLGIFAVIPLILLIVNSVAISYVVYICREEFI